MRHLRRLLPSAVVALTLTAIVTTSALAAVQFRGPQPAYFLSLSGGSSVENAADWFAKLTGSGLVNWSKQGVGVDNSFLEGTATRAETIQIEFDDEGASTIGGGVPSLRTYVRLGVPGLEAGESLIYTAFYVDGSSSGPVVVTLAGLSAGHFTVVAPGAGILDYVAVAAGPSTSVRLLFID